MPNFKILEYRLPLDAPWAVDPYLPVNGYLELRPDRAGWGLEIDPRALERDDYVHWERKLPGKPDGSTGYT
jgi:galactonate dehydratase